MKEVKNPRKPLIYYYGIAVLVIFLFNLDRNAGSGMNRQVKEVDYGTFMEMIDKKISERSKSMILRFCLPIRRTKHPKTGAQ